jgi:hypothetical protein
VLLVLAALAAVPVLAVATVAAALWGARRGAQMAATS